MFSLSSDQLLSISVCQFLVKNRVLPTNSGAAFNLEFGVSCRL